MGFFDKIKRAFTGEQEETVEEVVETDVEQDESDEQAVVVADTDGLGEGPEASEDEGEIIPDVIEAEVKPADVMPEVETTTEEIEAEVEPVELTEPIAVVEVAPVAPEEVPEPVEAIEEVAEVEVSAESEAAQKMDKGLKKTRRTFSQVLNELMANFRSVDEEFFEDLEETLITADVGFETSMRITDELRKEVKLRNAKKNSDVQKAIVEKMVEIYEENSEGENNQLNIQQGLTVMLFVGVNGVGKTTSIGKLANQYRLAGKKVLLAAADTFRAGAIDQLVVWGERAQVEVVRGNAGGDPAAVVYDAVEKAKAQNADILLVDTAGRLQNKVNLMNELEKIKRIIQREIPDGPHEVMLVVDATTGQNAMVQAKQFKETTDVTGLVLTKLDGTAKGGMVLAIRNELHIPVKLVGLGEGIDDLQPFNPNDFINGMFKELLEDN
ncbi:signal recognition particle-docking protein FtsY [uncultured Vagococcus sp.]|uniref:signal recognition particle-docking protein FtsY n=1 Tax=uncultured Vagococcus sp. TaxID=189676 RepID=UPI0028D4668D|nr:signal recognition particle-docking protein FtsY [uncultured Vagococcus sp.]